VRELQANVTGAGVCGDVAEGHDSVVLEDPVGEVRWSPEDYRRAEPDRSGSVWTRCSPPGACVSRR